MSLMETQLQYYSPQHVGDIFKQTRRPSRCNILPTSFHSLKGGLYPPFSQQPWLVGPFGMCVE